MRWFIFSVCFLALASCASIDTAKKAIAVKGAEVSAQALVDAEWWVCRAASVGSVKDRYGQSAERSQLYKAFCDGDAAANVIGK